MQPNSLDTRTTRAPAAGAIVLAAVLDVVVVLVFTASGRSEHGRIVSLDGVWETGWPYLVGLAATWVVALVWRRPFAVLRSGVPLWIGTLAIGMLLRVLFTEGGAALPFVLVAAGVLGFGLLGWRLVAVFVRRLTRAR